MNLLLEIDVVFKFLFIYLFLAVLCLCCSADFSLVAASRSYPLMQREGFSCCGAQLSGAWALQMHLLGSRAQAQQLLHGMWIRDQAHVSYIARQILYH